MCDSLEFMMDTYPESEQGSAEDCAMKLVEIIVVGLKYGVNFANGRPGGDQFCEKVDECRRQIRDCRLEFREAVVVQSLIKSGAMGMLWKEMIFIFANDNIHRQPRRHHVISSSQIEASQGAPCRWVLERDPENDFVRRGRVAEER